MKRTYLFILSTVLLFSFSNCNKDNEEPEPDPPAVEKVLIGEEYALGSGLKVFYYANEDLFVGYNKIYFTVKDSISGETLSSDLDINFLPMMNMDMMQHSCPTEDLVLNNDSKQYVGAVVYVMASMAGDWTMTVNITDNNTALSGEAMFELNVINPEEARLA